MLDWRMGCFGGHQETSRAKVQVGNTRSEEQCTISIYSKEGDCVYDVEELSSQVESMAPS